jgi:hypothetical protein
VRWSQRLQVGAAHDQGRRCVCIGGEMVWQLGGVTAARARDLLDQVRDREGGGLAVRWFGSGA